MHGAPQQNRPPRGHRAGWAALLAVSVSLAAVSCADFAAGHLLTGTTALISAALGGAAVLLLRLNWHLIQVSRALIDQNARLLAARTEPGAGYETATRKD